MKSRIIHVGVASIFTGITIVAQGVGFCGLTPPQPYDQEAALIVAVSPRLADSTLKGLHYPIVRPATRIVEYHVSAAG